MDKSRIICALFFLLISTHSHALDLHFQPRFEVGAVVYEWEEEGIREPGPQAGLFNQSSGRSIKDVLPFVSGGGTLFVGKFFIDFQAQYAFDGEDEDQFNNTTFVPASDATPFISSNSMVESNISSKTEFDRTEFAVSVGYALTENFFVYTGYKHAETDFEQQLVGQLRAHPINSSPNSSTPARFKSNLKTNLTYDGPFVGLGYSTNINAGFLHGALSTTFAVAFLDGRTKKKFSDSQVMNESSQEIPVNFNQFGKQLFGDNLNGSTTGFSAGITWRGFTPVKGLTYSIAASGYHYKFQSKTTPDFSEDIIRFNVALNYLF